MDLTVYHGWRIYAHVGKVPRNKIPEFKREIKSWFGHGDWSFKTNGEPEIYYERPDSKTKMLFVEEATDEAKSRAFGLTSCKV